MKRRTPFQYTAAAVLFLTVIFTATGCGGSKESVEENEEIIQADVPAVTAADGQAETQAEAQTGMQAETQEEAQTAVQEEAQVQSRSEKLTALRQQMDEPELFAVSCLGRTEAAWSGDGRALLQKLCPGELSKYPFLEEIPPERIVGSYGDLYCIVPKEEASSLTVNRLTWTADGEEWKEETGEELYHSESGEPILLFCNEEGYLDRTDVEVWITDADGGEIRWKPVFLDGISVLLPVDGKGHYAARDFTSYGPEKPEDYQSWIAESDWYVPTVDELEDTSWTAQTFPPDDDPASYTLSLYGNADGYSGYAGEAILSWCYGGDWEMQEEYNGWWGFVEKDQKAFLHLELGRIGGVQYQEGEEWKTICNEYPVLLHRETGRLLLLKGNKEDLLPFWREDQPFVILSFPYG